MLFDALLLLLLHVPVDSFVEFSCEMLSSLETMGTGKVCTSHAHQELRRYRFQGNEPDMKGLLGSPLSITAKQLNNEEHVSAHEYCDNISCAK